MRILNSAAVMITVLTVALSGCSKEPSEGSNKNDQVPPAPPQTQEAPATAKTPDVSGVWEGPSGVKMDVKATSLGFDVALNIVTANCTGEIAGSASLSSNVLTLSKKEENQTCTVNIKFSGNSAQIEEDNCSYYHGMACNFSGELKKVK